MALREGRCINCGSILFLDPKMPEGHCLFCDCVFKNEDAFRAATNPEEFTFPNEPQPEYKGPSLTPSQVFQGPIVPAVRQSGTKAAPVDDYVLPEKKIPKLKIPGKAIIAMFAVVLVVIGIFAAIAVPTVAKRNDQQKRISEVFTSSLPDEISIDSERDLLIQNIGCTSATVILGADITPEEGVKVFNNYCDARAEVLEIDTASFAKTRKPVTLRIAMPSGGFLIKNPNDEAELTTAAVTRLK